MLKKERVIHSMILHSNSIDMEKVQYVDENGDVVQNIDDISDENLIALYKWMVKARVYDERSMKYQRQGRIGTYAPFKGQEAAQVGSAFALNSGDWIYPSYREGAASLVHGLKMSQLFLYTMGHFKGLSQTEVNVFPIQIIIAAQCLHAVGGAWASQYTGTQDVSVAYVGDGGTSEGDFHEALNFAGLYKLPIVFFVQNNQWAISVPVSKQTASETIAQKAIGYGIDGVQVDGNDVVAVYKVMNEALQNAREGKPTLIEAVTYRQGPHTTADDQTKYRSSDEEDEWLIKDPLKRLKTLLIKRNIWDEEKDETEIALAEDLVTDAFEEAITTPKMELTDVMDNVYVNNTPQIKEQISLLRGD